MIYGLAGTRAPFDTLFRDKPGQNRFDRFRGIHMFGDMSGQSGGGQSRLLCDKRFETCCKRHGNPIATSRPILKHIASARK